MLTKNQLLKMRVLLEGDVVQFKLKTKPSYDDAIHAKLENDFASKIGSFKNKEETLAGAKQLISHINKHTNFSVMKDGISNDHHSFSNDLLNVSKGIRIAREKHGTNLKTYHGFQLYFNHKKTASFEDGYSGNTGIKIEKGIKPEGFANFIHNHVTNHGKRPVSEQIKELKSILLEGDVVQFKPKTAKPSYDDATYEAKKSNNSDNKSEITTWANKHLERNDGSSVTSEKAYSHYLRHCNTHNQEPVHFTRFRSHMTSHGFNNQHIAGKSRYLGISLHEEVQDPFSKFTRKTKNGTTKGFKAKTFVHADEVVTTATEHPTSKGKLLWKVSVNGKVKPNENKEYDVHKARIARVAMERLSHLLAAKRPKEVIVQHPEVGKVSHKHVKEMLTILGHKHGYDYQTSGTKKIQHILKVKKRW